MESLGLSWSVWDSNGQAVMESCVKSRCGLDSSGQAVGECIVQVCLVGVRKGRERQYRKRRFCLVLLMRGLFCQSWHASVRFVGLKSGTYGNGRKEVINWVDSTKDVHFIPWLHAKLKFTFRKIASVANTARLFGIMTVSTETGAF